jgi:hypothetical protein
MPETAKAAGRRPLSLHAASVKGNELVFTLIGGIELS